MPKGTTREKAFELFRANPRISEKELAAELGTTVRTARRHRKAWKDTQKGAMASLLQERETEEARRASRHHLAEVRAVRSKAELEAALIESEAKREAANRRAEAIIDGAMGAIRVLRNAGPQLAEALVEVALSEKTSDMARVAAIREALRMVGVPIVKAVHPDELKAAQPAPPPRRVLIADAKEKARKRKI